MSILELRERIRKLTGKPLAFARDLPVPPPRPESRYEPLEGEVVRVGDIPVLRREILYPNTQWHGRVRLGEFLDFDPECVRLIGGADGPGAREPGELAFLDTETTGVAGAGWCAFLAGVGEIRPEGFLLTQYVMRDLSEEPALLELLARHLERFPVVVTYNGRTFDWPLLSGRARINSVRLADPVHHLDLLHVARRMWRRPVGSARLVHLEAQVFGFRRVADMASAMVPEAYFHYLREGREDLLAEVVEHNAWDILSLGVLTAVAGAVLQRGKIDGILVDPLSLARLAEARRERDVAVRHYRQALEDGLPPAEVRALLPKLARMYRRQGDPAGAAWAWQELLARTQGMALHAYEELSRLNELVIKDRAAALQWSQAGLRAMSRGLAGLGGRIGKLHDRLRRRTERLSRPTRAKRTPGVAKPRRRVTKPQAEAQSADVRVECADAAAGAEERAASVRPQPAEPVVPAVAFRAPEE